MSQPRPEEKQKASRQEREARQQRLQEAKARLEAQAAHQSLAQAEMA